MLTHGAPRSRTDRRPYHRAMIPTPRSSAPLRLRRLPDRIAAARAIDVAEAFRDLPGLVLLESARPGRNARWTYLTADPSRSSSRRRPARTRSPSRAGSSPASTGHRSCPADVPPFLGGLVGFLGYDLGAAFERLPAIAPVDQDLPPLRLALHDWVVAWDRRTGHAWLGGRALDGDGRRLARRLDDVHARLTDARARPERRMPAPSGRGPARSSSDPGLDRRAYEAGVERIREHIARGDIYQANLTRRLETPFDGDPWPLYRRLRTGDPSLFSAYLDLGPGQLSGRPRALLSASPGAVPVGRRRRSWSRPTRSRARARAAGTRATDRALARELLSSAKDRAENVMIVDVLRNDLGRVCRPGTVRVPRLCRLERTAAVQHLVSTVTGRPGRRPRCLRPARGVVPGRIDHRSPEDPGDGDPRGARAGPARPVHRGDRLDRPGRGDADEHRDPDVRGRRAAADPPRRWRHHLEERPRGRVGGDGHEGARSARRHRRRWRSSDAIGSDRPARRPRLGRRPGAARPTAPTCPSSIAASSSATGSSRRSGSASCASDRARRAPRPSAIARRPVSGSRCRPTSRTASRRGSPALLAADGLDGPDGRRVRPDHRLARRVPRPGPAAARRGGRRDDRHPGLAGRAAAGRTTWNAAST